MIRGRETHKAIYKKTTSWKAARQFAREYSFISEGQRGNGLMTERQLLILERKNLLAAKRDLMSIDGIQVMEVYEKGQNQELNQMYSSYISNVYKKNVMPYSRLPKKASKTQLCFWVIDTMGLREGQEYFYYCGSGIWAKIRISDLQVAAQSLCHLGGGIIGFLLAEVELSRMLELSFDSRDEYNYLIDIWEYSDSRTTQMP
ncbi:hypothetical protein B5F35_13600 [Anaeromassilibacillus sp. An200]|nr:hypothetical protein B5F35_13600 [Anaeromassilibacillus sp. An200]